MSWLLRHVLAKPRLDLGVPLKRAREKRDEARKLIADGIDPNARRKALRDAPADTFEVVVAEWLALRSKALSADTMVMLGGVCAAGRGDGRGMVGVRPTERRVAHPGCAHDEAQPMRASGLYSLNPRSVKINPTPLLPRSEPRKTRRRTGQSNGLDSPGPLSIVGMATQRHTSDGTAMDSYVRCGWFSQRILDPLRHRQPVILLPSVSTANGQRIARWGS